MTPYGDRYDDFPDGCDDEYYEEDPNGFDSVEHKTLPGPYCACPCPACEQDALETMEEQNTDGLRDSGPQPGNGQANN
jgi:hypothetical protein